TDCGCLIAVAVAVTIPTRPNAATTTTSTPRRRVAMRPFSVCAHWTRGGRIDAIRLPQVVSATSVAEGLSRPIDGCLGYRRRSRHNVRPDPRFGSGAAQPKVSGGSDLALLRVDVTEVLHHLERAALGPGDVHVHPHVVLTRNHLGGTSRTLRDF